MNLGANSSGVAIIWVSEEWLLIAEEAKIANESRSKC